MSARTITLASLLVPVFLLPGCAAGVGTPMPPPQSSAGGGPPATLARAASPVSPAVLSTGTRTSPFPSARVASATAGAAVARGRIGPAARLSRPRAAHSATLLPDGRVLIAGGCTRSSCEVDAEGATAELYDPAAGVFAPTGRMTVERVGHRAVLLRDGRVLLVGGWGRAGPLASAELYDPSSGTFAPTGTLRDRRGGHSATLLADGRVLVAGGTDGARELASAELYDPRTGTFAPSGDLLTARAGHVAVARPDGAVYVLGGSGGRGNVLASAELFSPSPGTFGRLGEMTVPRHKHAAALLPNGLVLIVGGSDARDFAGRYTGVEVYDPAAGLFRALTALGRPRFKLEDAVVVLPSGAVLVAGGGDRAEILDPGTSGFRPVAGDLGAAWSFATATPLRDGRVLIVGGYDERINLTAGAWLFEE
jgi:hypothetical protein